MKNLLCLSILLLSLSYAYTVEFLQTSDGDSVYCIDKHHQPAFGDPLLSNHKFQDSPSEMPKKIHSYRKSKWQTNEARVSTVDCPKGMVPVLEYFGSPELGHTGHTIDKHEYAEALTPRTTNKLFGTQAKFSVWSPSVEYKGTEISISQIWINAGDHKRKKLNTIEVGWQVFPVFYNDSKPRFFTYWTRDSYLTTGGYNLKGPGFIQTNNNIVIGGSISPISSVGGSQYEITILVWKDRQTGNWWLSLGSENLIVGYWPREIFTTLGDYANVIEWGGEVIDSRIFGRHTKTQMGSGKLPEIGFGKASFIRKLEVVDSNNNLQTIQKVDTYTNSPYYDVKTSQSDDEWGTHIFYGGSGYTPSHSGVFLFRLSYNFLCFGLLVTFVLLMF